MWKRQLRAIRKIAASKAKSSDSIAVASSARAMIFAILSVRSGPATAAMNHASASIPRGARSAQRRGRGNGSAAGTRPNDLADRNRRRLHGDRDRRRSPHPNDVESGQRRGIVEDDHHAVAREMLDGSLVLADEPPDLRVVFAKNAHHVLGLGGLRERREAAQVHEDDRDLAPARSERIVELPGGDELRDLGREESLQAREPRALIL